MIAFEQVSFSYDGESRRDARKGTSISWVLRDLDFCVEEGAFVGVAGPTGSGKSTLLQHLNGLLHPTRGHVIANGTELAQQGTSAIARSGIGLVFQYPERQLFAATVYEDVAFGPRNLGRSADQVDQDVNWALERVGLEAALAQRNPFGLSGGQRRRAAIAGVVAMHPHTLVLDEPAAGLDPAAHKRVLALIDEFHDGGMTIVMASHDMDDLAAHCDQVLVLNEGRRYAFGTPAEVFADTDGLRAIGLDAPHTAKMADELRAAGFDLPAGFLDEESLVNAIARDLKY